MRYIKVVDHPNLVRDTYSKAILNTDSSVVRKHEQRMKDLQKEQARDIEINNIKNDIVEIKSMLKSLLEFKVM
jgi:hypothetical protein